MKIIVFQLLLMMLLSTASAQTFESGNVGGNIGLSLAVGNRFDRLGIFLQGFYTNDFFQINSGFYGYYNFRNLGPHGRYFEWSPTIGAVLSYGRKDTLENHFFSSVSNQTMRSNSIGYSYNFYFNKIQTTQNTGTLSLQFGSIQFIIENDFLAFSTSDQFRTGAFLLQYRNDKFQFGIYSTLWTGKKGNSIKDPDFPSRLGYVDMSQSLYGNLSHGLLSFQLQYAAPYGQMIQANIGVDAEQVRNALQNKLLHDLIFTPESWNLSNNPHIPMLDREGKMYLYKDGQQIKPVKLYFNLFFNPALFY